MCYAFGRPKQTSRSRRLEATEESVIGWPARDLALLKDPVSMGVETARLPKMQSYVDLGTQSNTLYKNKSDGVRWPL